MSKIQLLKGDCLELLGTLEDKSIDLVLTDPPYNIGKDKRWDKWKTQEAYVEWCGKWLLECQRVLKDNGSMYFFHNNMVQIAQLMEWIRVNTGFVFNSFIIWDKGNFRAQSWKNPSEKSKLRSWFTTCEYCLYYTFQEEKEFMGANKEIFKPYIDYINYELNKNNLKWDSPEILDVFVSSGVSKNRADAKNRIFHNLDTRTTQLRFISEVNYNLLKPVLKFEKEYEELRKEYEELRYTHNLDQNHNNIWTSTEKRNSGKLHPTQKPTDLLERIIRTSSNEGDLVLDCFMGSGSTGVAAVNLNRDFIGIERDEQYFEIAKERIENSKIALKSK